MKKPDTFIPGGFSQGQEHIFDVQSIPKKEWLDAFLAEQMGNFPFNIKAVAGRECPFFTRDVVIGGVGLNEMRMPSLSIWKAPRTFTNCGTEYLHVRCVVRGSADALIDDTFARMQPDEIHVMDAGRPISTLLSAPTSWRAIRIPYELVGYDPRSHPAHFKISNQSLTGRALFRFLTQNQTRALTTYRFADVAQNLSGLLRSALGFVGLDDRSVQAIRIERKNAIKTWLDRSAVEKLPDFDEIPARFGISRATLFRMFQDSGGVHAYMRKRVLERAFKRLSDGKAYRGRIREVAEGCGFHDPGHFNRCFRRQFGLSPSDAIDFPPGLSIGSKP